MSRCKDGKPHGRPRTAAKLVGEMRALRKKLRKKGISHRQIAERLGVSRTSVIRLLRRSPKPQRAIFDQWRSDPFKLPGQQIPQAWARLPRHETWPNPARSIRSRMRYATPMRRGALARRLRMLRARCRASLSSRATELRDRPTVPMRPLPQELAKGAGGAAIVTPGGNHAAETVQHPPHRDAALDPGCHPRPFTPCRSRPGGCPRLPPARRGPLPYVPRRRPVRYSRRPACRPSPPP
jgi:transcriptional regulator with XRE-family HTH domain